MIFYDREALVVGAFLLWAWLTRKLDRGHMDPDRSIDHYMREQETRRHPF